MSELKTCLHVPAPETVSVVRKTFRNNLKLYSTDRECFVENVVSDIMKSGNVTTVHRESVSENDLYVFITTMLNKIGLVETMGAIIACFEINK